MAPATVGRIVHYYDREECVNADQQQRNPEPYAAIVTRVHRDQEGNPLDVLNLGVFDPEVGYQLKRDVRPGDPDVKPEAHRWYWPPRDAAPTATKKRPPAPPADEGQKEPAVIE